VLFYPPGSGIGYEFFPDPGSQIPDPEGMFFGEILNNPCSYIFLLTKLVPQTKRSKKKVGFIFHPSFYVYSSVRSGMTNLGIRIRDKTSRTLNTDFKRTVLQTLYPDLDP
jgi:hypothetical protein